MRHARFRDYLYEYVRGELDEESARSIERHLEVCPSCRTELEVLRSAFESFPPGTTKASDERSEAYWEDFVGAVERRIANSEEPSIPEAFRALATSIRHALWQPKPILAGVVATLVLACGLWLLVRLSASTTAPELKNIPAVSVSSTQAVEDYLSSSRMLLIGITNMEPEGGKPVDLGLERRTARSLIQQARLISQGPIDRRSKELIQELERILIELANLEETADLPDVEMIRSGVRQQNLLFKIRMAENQLDR